MDTEIEITPEMIEVGMKTFLEHDPEPSLARLEVALIETFRAMSAARSQS
jgi:hypothetical protein